MKKSERLMSICEDLLDILEDLQMNIIGIDGGILYVDINGNRYGYQSANPEMPLTKILDSAKGMAKYSSGKALAYLKKNTKLVSGSKRG